MIVISVISSFWISKSLLQIIGCNHCAWKIIGFGVVFRLVRWMSNLRSGTKQGTSRGSTSLWVAITGTEQMLVWSTPSLCTLISLQDVTSHCVSLGGPIAVHALVYFLNTTRPSLTKVVCAYFDRISYIYIYTAINTCVYMYICIYTYIYVH